MNRSWRLLRVKQMWRIKFGKGLEVYTVLHESMLTKHHVVYVFRVSFR